MSLTIKAIVQRFTQGRNGPNVPVELALSGLGSLRTHSLEGPHFEKARAGRMFHGGTQIIANGIAPVAAIPTVTATLALINGDVGSSGKIIELDHISLFLGSGTAAAGLTLLATVAPILAAAVPNVQPTGYGVSPTRGKAAASIAFWATALTLQGAPAWEALFSSLQLAAANVGQGDQPHEVRGAIVIPPQHALGLAILSGAGTTPLYGVSARWAEIEGDIE